MSESLNNLQTFSALVALRFSALSLESDHNCGYDYIEVRDGDDLSSPVIGRYCGKQLPPPIKSSGNFLHILFTSDGYNSFDGFVIIFQESSGRYNHIKCCECYSCNTEFIHADEIPKHST